MRWKSTFAFNNGVATLGPPPEGYVWTITLSIPNAQSDQTFALTMQESLQSYQLTSLAGTAGFGPYQIFPQEQMLVTAQQGTTPNQLVVVFGRQDLVKDAPTGIYPSVWGGTVTTTGFNAMQWQGDWISTASYLIGAIVVGPDGRTYVATASNANTPPPNVSYWAQLEPLAGQNVAIYNVPGSYTWTKPLYVTTVRCLLISGGGGGGGGGMSTGSTIPAGGGGGGASSPMIDYEFLASDLGDTVNLVVGAGGTGGLGAQAGGSGVGANGGSGSSSSFGPLIAPGSGGGGGGSTSAGGSGAGGSLADFPGVGGGNGGLAATGNTGPGGYRTSGGGGGGGALGATEYSGGNAAGLYDSWFGIAGGSGGAAPGGVGGNGNNVSVNLGPTTGGGGGGGSGSNVNGGAGGNGATGSGGGGGGASYNGTGSLNGGNGGNGGNGIVVVIAK